MNQPLDQLRQLVSFSLTEIRLLTFTKDGQQIQWQALIVKVVNDAGTAALSGAFTRLPQLADPTGAPHKNTCCWEFRQVCNERLTFRFAQNLLDAADKLRHLGDRLHALDYTPMD